MAGEVTTTPGENTGQPGDSTEQPPEDDAVVSKSRLRMWQLGGLGLIAALGGALFSSELRSHDLNDQLEAAQARNPAVVTVQRTVTVETPVAVNNVNILKMFSSAEDPYVASHIQFCAGPTGLDLVDQELTPDYAHHRSGQSWQFRLKTHIEKGKCIAAPLAPPTAPFQPHNYGGLTPDHA